MVDKSFECENASENAQRYRGLYILETLLICKGISRTKKQRGSMSVTAVVHLSK